RDPMYDFGDFVTLSYISILMAKKNYESKDKRLTPFMCRGKGGGDRVRRRRTNHTYRPSPTKTFI
ncbi:MAG: hypothetical protein LBI57_03655, partial [Helicobacteraceae bacterium]|nr:hypothetical protein [Helicobacteraceae bacterium]